MSNMLKVAEEVEEKLNSVGLVGLRIGSGFSFADNSRDVQFNYTSGIIEGVKAITENYHRDIEKVVNEVVSKYDDLKVRFIYRLDNFSFYIAPKREKVERKEEVCGGASCEFCEEECCEEECCEEDSVGGNSIKGLNLYSNRAEILLKVINYGLAHMTFTADDLGELSGIQEELMKYTEEDK